MSEKDTNWGLLTRTKSELNLFVLLGTALISPPKAYAYEKEAATLFIARKDVPQCFFKWRTSE